MRPEDERPVPFGEVVSEPFDARFDAGAIWEDATLLASPQEVSRRVEKASGEARDLSQALSFVDAAIADEDGVDRLLSLSRWLLMQPVRGPKVLTTLHELVAREYRELAGASVEDADSRFATLQNRLAQLPVSADSGGRTALGELLPRDYLLRSEGAEQTLKLAQAPARALDMSDPREEIRLLHDGFKGCTACRPDPESSLGGSKYCIFPGWEGRVECEWPPPEPPEPVWEYYVQVGNKWWTTFIGAWRGSAYTRTVKKIAGNPTMLPWTVPLLTASVAAGKAAPFKEPWCKIGHICSWCWERAEKGPGSEVTVSNWEFAFYGPWGVESRHSGGGRAAFYCDGYWGWS